MAVRAEIVKARGSGVRLLHSQLVNCGFDSSSSARYWLKLVILDSCSGEVDGENTWHISVKPALWACGSGRTVILLFAISNLEAVAYFVF